MDTPDDTAVTIPQSAPKATADYWWKTGTAVTCAAPKPGHLCPECGQGQLAYDSLFNLVCPRCDYVAGSGAFT